MDFLTIQGDPKVCCLIQQRALILSVQVQTRWVLAEVLQWGYGTHPHARRCCKKHEWTNEQCTVVLAFGWILLTDIHRAPAMCRTLLFCVEGVNGWGGCWPCPHWGGHFVEEMDTYMVQRSEPKAKRSPEGLLRTPGGRSAGLLP